MRVNLKVPFAEKDEAKKLGARWDAARKIWYVENKPDMAPFARWAPSPHDNSAGDGKPVGAGAGDLHRELGICQQWRHGQAGGNEQGIEFHRLNYKPPSLPGAGRGYSANGRKHRFVRVLAAGWT